MSYVNNRSRDKRYLGRMESPEMEEEEEEYRTTDIEEICEVTHPSRRQREEVLPSGQGFGSGSAFLESLDPDLDPHFYQDLKFFFYLWKTH